MARIYKVVGYFVDSSNETTVRDIFDIIEAPDFVCAKHFKVECEEIPDWDDDNPLNKVSCPKEECDKYFN